MIHSFLMIGQSNMAGRGAFGDVPPIDNPSLKVLRNGRWQPFFTPVKPDHLHFTAAAQRRFGLRYYEAFRALEDRDRVFMEKPCEDDALRTAIDGL